MMIHTDLVGMPVYTQDMRLGVVRLVTSKLQAVIQTAERFEEHCILDLTPALNRPISTEAAFILNSTTGQIRTTSYIMRLWTKMLDTYKEGDSIKYRYSRMIEGLRDEADTDC